MHSALPPSFAVMGVFESSRYLRLCIGFMGDVLLALLVRSEKTINAFSQRWSIIRFDR
jgi:hypothetical protein